MFLRIFVGDFECYLLLCEVVLVVVVVVVLVVVVEFEGEDVGCVGVVGCYCLGDFLVVFEVDVRRVG